MPILRTILYEAARRLAADERVQQKAAETYRHKVKPKAEAAWEAARPRIEETRADVGRIARETDARRHPARFAGRAARRIVDEFRRKPDER